MKNILDYFQTFSHPRIAALVFEGAVLGTLGWFLVLISGVGAAWLNPFGRIAMLVGILTILFGVLGYVVLLVNDLLQSEK